MDKCFLCDISRENSELIYGDNWYQVRDKKGITNICPLCFEKLNK